MEIHPRGTKPTLLLPGDAAESQGRRRFPGTREASLGGTMCLEFLHSVLTLLLGSRGETYGLGGCCSPSLKEQLCLLIPVFLFKHENNLKPVAT